MTENSIISTTTYSICFSEHNHAHNLNLNLNLNILTQTHTKSHTKALKKPFTHTFSIIYRSYTYTAQAQHRITLTESCYFNRAEKTHTMSFQMQGYTIDVIIGEY